MDPSGSAHTSWQRCLGNIRHDSLSYIIQRAKASTTTPYTVVSLQHVLYHLAVPQNPVLCRLYTGMFRDDVMSLSHTAIHIFEEGGERQKRKSQMQAQSLSVIL